VIKVISFLRRNPALSPEEFRHYWETVHVPLIKSRLPGLRHYAGCFPLAGQTLPEADAVVELGFDDVETMEREMSSPAFLDPVREASSARLLDLASVRNYLVEVVDAM
jgi:uncharacterized protein (TIGR02118 family)